MEARCSIQKSEKNKTVGLGVVKKKLQRRINKNPGRPIRRLAADLKVDESTIRRYLKEHIRYRSYKMRKGQFITEEPKARRFEKAKKLLNKLKNMGKKDRQGTALIFFLMKKISHKIKR